MNSKNESTDFSEQSKARFQEKKEILSKALGHQPLEDISKKSIKITERKALLASSFLNIVAVSALLLVVIGGDHNSFGIGGNNSYKKAVNNSSFNSINAPEIKENISPIKYGFNTHVHSVLDTPNDNMTLETYKKGIDILASNNLNMVRLDIRAKEFARSWI